MKIVIFSFVVLFNIILSLVVYKLISRELKKVSEIKKRIIAECKSEEDRNIALKLIKKRNIKRATIISLAYYIGLPIICFPFLLIIRMNSASNIKPIIASQEYLKKYSFTETWYSSEAAEGKSIYEIKIKESTKNENNRIDEMQAELFHTITPFSQIICTDIILKRTENNKYDFSFTDAWNNKAFGWIIFYPEEIELYLDCNDFDETGKNFARLYGETIKLHETTNDKDFLERELGEE